MKEGKFLVTGANGFLGSNLVEHLAGQGIQIRAMVRNLKKSENIRQFCSDIVEGDLRDPASLRRAADGIAGVYNIAATYREGGLPDSTYQDINATGVKNLLDAAIDAGVRRFVHCSTVGVLGDCKEIPATETTPYNPGDIYQRTKLEGENIALDYFRSKKIEGVVLRPGIIWGPGDTRTLKIFRMVARGVFFYVGSGENLLHYVDARDLARAFRLAMENDRLNAEVYIIPGERPMTTRQLAELIAQELGVRKPWLHLPVKPMQLLGEICERICIPLGINPPIYRRRVDFYTKNRSFSGAKAERDLGFRPTQSSDSEVREITRWYRDHGWL